MRLRQEQVVFGVVALILGTLVLTQDKASASRVRASTPRGLELEHVAIPDTARAYDPGAGTPLFERELFTPPSDTRALPPLELSDPPVERLAILFPPPVPEPRPRHFAPTLRVPFEIRPVEGLFDGDDVALPALGPAGFEVEAALAAASPSEESAADRGARIEGYKSLYDWIRLNEFQHLFGRIENEDRYGIGEVERRDEPILFLQLDPRTGAERYPGQGAIPYERERVSSYGFARTTSNEIELRRRDFLEISRGNYLLGLEFADYCVRNRLEAPRALEIAREVYERLRAFDPADPAPELGLARCHEAGFEFERALEIYEDLVQRFDHRAGPHVRLAKLEARFLLFDSAEVRLRRAVEVERSDYEANWALGAFLLEHGRPQEALEFLEFAQRYEPRAPERRDVRLAIRLDGVECLVALGRIEDAVAKLRAGLSGSTDDPRLRGIAMALEVLGGERLLGPESDATHEASFEGLLAHGLIDARNGATSRARDLLLAAAEHDPLRAHAAWRALAYLALVSGYHEAAVEFVLRALEVEPRDAYAHYLHGRLLEQIDDHEGAREAFEAALELDPDFEDATVSRAEIEYRRGAHDDAERYFERAVKQAPDRVDVRSLRGLNLLALGQIARAQEAFENALSLDPLDPTAQGGLAWCLYLEGDSAEALVQFANLDERRRDLAEEDPWRVWAAEQIARISDHLQKVAWVDEFERRELRNGWIAEERSGPTVQLAGGAVRVEGVFERPGETRVFREYPAGLFVSFEADVRIAPEGNARVGVFVAREVERSGREVQVAGDLSMARHKDGPLQVRVRRGSGDETAWVDVPVADFPAGEWVRVRIEREGDGAQTRFSTFVNGIPAAQEEAIPALGRATSPLRVGLFAQGETGRRTRVELDRVQVVYRR